MLNRVLVVDDSIVTLKYMRKILSDAGYEVTCATDAAEALATFEASLVADEPPFDLILTDWVMPGMSGLEFCRLVREQNPNRYTYIMMLTARSKTADIVEALNAGADDYITKPIDKHLLLARMRAGVRVLTLERQLRRESRRDALTGLLNRGTLIEVIEQEWHRAMRNGSYLSCLIVDIDNFQTINAQHGHTVGDNVLRQVAETLQQSLRVTDFLGRFGGQKFCLLLPQTPDENAGIVAERCRKAIESATFETTAGHPPAAVTVSIGLGSNSAKARSAMDLLELSEAALVEAKRTGRNRFARVPGMTTDEPLPVG